MFNGCANGFGSEYQATDAANQRPVNWSRDHSQPIRGRGCNKADENVDFLCRKQLRSKSYKISCSLLILQIDQYQSIFNQFFLKQFHLNDWPWSDADLGQKDGTGNNSQITGHPRPSSHAKCVNHYYSHYLHSQTDSTASLARFPSWCVIEQVGTPPRSQFQPVRFIKVTKIHRKWEDSHTFS